MYSNSPKSSFYFFTHKGEEKCLLREARYSIEKIFFSISLLIKERRNAYWIYSISLLIKERRFPYDEQALQSDEATYYIYCPECKARIELNKVKILVDRQQQDTTKTIE